MAIDLQRTALLNLYRAARGAHPGLLIQRGLPDYSKDDQTGRTDWVQKLCAIPADPWYRQAYDRWARLTANDLRFRQVILRLDTRLFIGLSAGGMLETGCAISHAYGVPYIPGSGVKGPVKAHVLATGFGQANAPVVNELFGVEPGDANPLGLSGVVTFHDAWWVPDSAPKPHPNRPLVQEVVTTHHPDYYQHEGATEATDFDSPVPNAQIAVQGSFLFVLEGDPAWTDLAMGLLTAALASRGLGAKTRAGYGFFSPDPERQAALERQRADWAREAQQRQEAAAQRRAAQDARKAFEEASPERQRIMQVAEQVTAFLALDLLLQRSRRSDLIGTLKELTEVAAGWAAQHDRTAAADLIEQAYEQIGWADPDKKRPDQREKQEKKRRQAIAALRVAPPAGATN